MWYWFARRALPRLGLCLGSAFVFAQNAFGDDQYLYKPASVFRPTTQQQCDDLQMAWETYTGKLLHASEECSRRINEGRARLGSDLRALDEYIRRYDHNCPRDSTGWCVADACGNQTLYFPSACKSEHVQFECAIKERSEAIAECKNGLSAYQQEQERERQEQQRQQQEQQRLAEESKHEQAQREAEQKRQERETHRRERDKREADYHKEQDRVSRENARLQREASQLGEQSQRQMQAAQRRVDTSSAGMRNVVTRSLASVEDSLRNANPPVQDGTKVDTKIIDNLSDLAKDVNPLASIPISLTTNVFRADLQAMNDLNGMLRNFDTATPADADRISSRFMQSAFGAQNVLTTIVSPTVGAYTPAAGAMNSLHDSGSSGLSVHGAVASVAESIAADGFREFLTSQGFSQVRVDQLMREFQAAGDALNLGGYSLSMQPISRQQALDSWLGSSQ